MKTACAVEDRPQVDEMAATHAHVARSQVVVLAVFFNCFASACTSNTPCAGSECASAAAVEVPTTSRQGTRRGRLHAVLGRHTGRLTAYSSSDALRTRRVRC